VSERKRALDLFCGTKSVTRTLEELGYAVTTFDVRPEFKANFTVDIRKWKYWTTCRPGDFEVIWASIHCTKFIQALTTRDRDLRTADSIARRTLKIIRWLKPKKFFIENPTGCLLLQHRRYIQKIAKIRVDYCQFQPSWGYKKPTYIFG
jgi:site-specific DNA-cytosine methylase